MRTYHLTVKLPDGNKIIAKARAATPEEEVQIQWSGAINRLGEVTTGKYGVGFLRWYLDARARQLGGEFEFHEQNGE
jgi:hypothetical protein